MFPFSVQVYFSMPHFIFGAKIITVLTPYISTKSTLKPNLTRYKIQIFITW